MRELLLLVLLLLDGVYSFGSQCGCATSAFSTLCPPGFLCFNKLVEKDCAISCSSGDLRYLSSFLWQTSPFLRCDTGQYRRPNGTAVLGVTELVCTEAPPCNRCPPITFNDYCEGSYKCENTLTTVAVDQGCSRTTCQRGELMVKNGKRFLMTKSLTCSSDGVWHTAEGSSIDANEATCTMKRNCQSCDTPSISKACGKGEIVCNRDLIKIIGGKGFDSSQCRKISCKDSHVTIILGDKIVTDKSISCNAAGSWALDSAGLELATNLEVTCSVPNCETCVELKLTPDCPPEARCESADVLKAGGPTENQCSIIKEGALWVEATALTCDAERRWVSERKIRVSNSAAVTCAQYKCDACPDIVADEKNRCPKDAQYCHREYLKTGFVDSQNCQKATCQMGQMTVFTGREFKSTEALSCRAGKWRTQNGEPVGSDVIGTCAFLPCSSCLPIQTLINNPDGSVTVLQLDTLPNTSNCSHVDCGEGDIAMYQNGAWRDVRSLTCNYDRQYVVELDQMKEAYPEGRPVTDYFLAKCTKAKACDHCEELATTGECHNGFCNPNLLERSLDTNGCKKIACPTFVMVQDGANWVQTSFLKCKSGRWITDASKPVPSEARVTCKADHAPPPCQNCTFAMTSGESRSIVEDCLIVHCRPKGRNVKVFSRYWGTYLEVWYMRCSKFGWMSQSSVLINDVDPYTITARVSIHLEPLVVGGLHNAVVRGNFSIHVDLPNIPDPGLDRSRLKETYNALAFRGIIVERTVAGVRRGLAEYGLRKMREGVEKKCNCKQQVNGVKIGTSTLSV